MREGTLYLWFWKLKPLPFVLNENPLVVVKLWLQPQAGAIKLWRRFDIPGKRGSGTHLGPDPAKIMHMLNFMCLGRIKYGCVCRIGTVGTSGQHGLILIFWRSEEIHNLCL